MWNVGGSISPSTQRFPASRRYGRTGELWKGGPQSLGVKPSPANPYRAAARGIRSRRRPERIGSAAAESPGQELPGLQQPTDQVALRRRLPGGWACQSGEESPPGFARFATPGCLRHVPLTSTRSGRPPARGR